MDIESCGGGIRFLALSLFVLGYVGIYRRKKYVGGRLWGPGDRACLEGVGVPSCLLAASQAS